jgi:glyoxylase-like metal-dependent hydrolase (beta-lactamase superfamily II)
MTISKWHLLKIGACSHPEFTTIKGGGLKCHEFPAMVGLLLHDDFGPILFDTGYDKAFFEATNNFPEKLYRLATPVLLEESQNIQMQLARFSLKPNDIKAIFISHFHGDHIAGLGNFPNAKIFCAKAGFVQTQKGTRFSRTRQGILSALIPSDFTARASFFEDFTKIPLGSEFAPFDWAVDILGDNSLLAVELIGHCPGHWGLIAKTNEAPVFFIGDAAWSIKAVSQNRPPPDLTIKLLGQVDKYHLTLDKLSTLYKNSQNRLAIIPSHCAVTSKFWLDKDED